MPKHKKTKQKPKKSNSFLNKDVLFLIGMGIVFMVMIAGTSYAILKMTVWGEKKNEVIAGTLSIEYKDGKTINLDNTYPMTDARGMTTPSYQFSVENTGDIDTKYEITLEEATKNQNTLDISYLRYSIKKGDEDWSVPKDLDSLILENEVELKVGEKKSYQLRIWIKESAGNETQGKEFKARIVVNAIQDNENLQDVTPPVIKLKGDLSVNVEENSEYEDLGVESVEDNKDNLNSDDVKISYEYYNENEEETTEEDHVDTSKVGVHYIYYRISDKSKNEGLIVRSVNVYHKDTTPPEITLNGANIVAVEKDTEYIDQGATAIDSEEQDITDRLVVIGTVNTKKLGTYTIKYLITDQSGNTASVVRVVNVVTTSINLGDNVVLDLSGKKTEQIEISGENIGEVTYRSKNDQIADVDGNGLITGKEVGETTIIISSTSGYYKEITVTVQKTINIKYVKQGLGVSAIGKETDTCIMKTTDGCDVVAPSITVMDEYTAVGWSSEQDAKDGTAVGKNITVKESGNYYAISYKNEITYTVNFNANGNTIDAESKTCKRAKAYNNHPQAENCTIITPTITAPSETPIVVGYNQNQTAHEKEIGSAEELTVDDSVNGRTYYAITKRDQVTRSLVFKANGNKIDNNTSDISKTCQIDAVYNGVIQKASCDIITPEITASNANTPKIIGYNEDSKAQIAQIGSKVSVTITSEMDKKNYYAITSNDIIKRTITFDPNGNVAFTYNKERQTTKKTYDLCTIPETYNGEAQATSCSSRITMPTIEAHTNTPNLIGWSTASTKREVDYTSGEENVEIIASSNLTYYAQTMATEMTRKITFYKNNNKSFTYNSNKYTDTSKTFDLCKVPISYNGGQEGESCQATITMPIIEANDNTPTLIGWTTGATIYTNPYTSGQVSVTLTATSDLSFYAQTKKDQITRSLVFKANGNKIDNNTTDISKTCQIAETHNGEVQKETCEITTPTITASNNNTPKIVGYNEDSKGTTAQLTSATKTDITETIDKKTYYAITTNTPIKRSITFNPNGNPSFTYAGTKQTETKTYDLCTIGASYNGVAQATSCKATITMASIEAPNNTPTAVGWSTGATTRNASYTSGQANAEVTASADVTYYAQTKKASQKVTITFNKNGAQSQTDSAGTAKTDNTVTRECTRSEVWNNAVQGNCTVKSPTIVGTSNTPTVVGYSTVANTHSNGWTHNTDKEVNADATWYAQTKKASQKVTITFNKNGAQSQTDSAGTAKTDNTVTRECTRSEVWNNAVQGNCTVKSPTIVGTTNTPTVVGYSAAAATHSNGWTHNTDKEVSADATWYAQTKKASQKVTITFNKNGAQSQTDSTGTAKTDATVTRECTRAEVWNNAVQGNCTVKSPTIVGTTNTPTVVGYSTAAGTHSNGWTHNTDKEVSADATWYAQTKKASQKVTITFNKNGAQSQTDSTGTAKTDATVTRECTRAEAWNNATQGNCTVKSPTIVGTTNTPTVVGYSAAAATHSNGWTHNTDKEVNADATWYAQTKKASQKVTITFNKNGAQSQTDSTGAAKTDNTVTRECTRAEAWNNAVQGNCTVKSPIIVGTSNTPTVVGYSTAAATHSNGWTHNTDKEVSTDATWYAQTKKGAVTRKITFNPNGNTAYTYSGTRQTATKSYDLCTIGETWNNAAQSTSCSKAITMPTIEAASNTTTIIGWSTGSSRHSKDYGSGESVTLSASSDLTYYAQTRNNTSYTRTVTFYRNGATSLDGSTATSVTRSCSIDYSYNGASQSTSCSITSPKIVASSATPNITGFSTSSSSHTNAWTHNTSKSISADASYYAQTYSSSFSRSVNYSKGSGVSSIGKNSDSCTVASSYNGASQGSSCTVVLPSITSKTGYNTGFWSTSSTASSGSAAGASITLSSATAPTYYAIAKDTTKPVWSLTSKSSSGSGSSTTIKLTITGSDTSGSATAIWTTSTVTVKVGGTKISPSLSVTNSGLVYTLTITNFTGSGAVVVEIAANSLQDDSGNKNDLTTITTGYTIEAKTGWYTENSCQVYYSNGVKLTGWQTISGNTYYLRPSTGCREQGWLKNTEQSNCKSNYYWFDSNGVMQTGWKQLDGKWYYLAKGNSTEGKWQTSQRKGCMMTGWVYSTDYSCETSGWYFDSSGAMVSGQIVDGYTLNSSGCWITTTGYGSNNCNIRGDVLKTYSAGWTCSSGHHHTTYYQAYCSSSDGSKLTVASNSVGTIKICPTSPYGTSSGWKVVHDP